MGKYMNFFTYTLLDVIYRKADSLIQNNILFNSKNSLVEKMNPTPPPPPTPEGGRERIHWEQMY